MIDYRIVFRNEEDFGNTLFHRDNIPIPRKGEKICLINPMEQHSYEVLRVEYNYYERNEALFNVEVFLKEIKTNVSRGKVVEK